MLRPVEIRIQPATADTLEAVRKLFREYQDWLGVDLCFQGFEAELAELPGQYASPQGALLLAMDAEETVGCVGVRPLAGDVCEMKRLYVRPHHRGRGAGRSLAAAAIAAAREVGYRVMRLDTLERLSEAMRLYESLGFVRVAPYYANPLPGVVYWQLSLDAAGMQTRSRG